MRLLNGVRRSACIFAMGAAAVCLVATAPRASAQGTATTAGGTAGDVERTTFAPVLNIHLDSMVKRPSGLYVQDLTRGTGAVAVHGKTVVVRYTGWLANGKQFDTGEITLTLGTNRTIRAWEEGLLGMRVGGKRKLVVPPSMGYGAVGAGNGDIPPNAILVFDMEMTSIL